MRHRLRILGVLIAVALSGPAWATDLTFGAREGSILGGPPPGTASSRGDILNEEFINITTLPGDGWLLINHSEPVGTTSWFQGTDVFPANYGLPSEYIAANYNNCGVGTPQIISNWLITPEIDFALVEVIEFHTRTITGSNWQDRLQFRLSNAGDSTDIGTSSTDVGVFTTMLVDINSSYALGGYPEEWTEFLFYPLEVGTGRLAFRYFVESAGPAGVYSNFIGIDSFDVSSWNGDVFPPNVPATGTWGVVLLIAMFAAVSAFVLRQRAGRNK